MALVWRTKSSERQAPSNLLREGLWNHPVSNKLDKTSQIMYDEDIMNVRKKLVKEIKKTNPDLADEIKYMSVKEFKALMEVFNVWCRL